MINGFSGNNDMDYSYTTAFGSEVEIVEKFSEQINEESNIDNIDSLISVLNSSNISIRDSISTL